MTPRPHAWTRRAALATALAAASLLSLPGCNPMTLFYFLQPFEPTIPAPGPSLKGKKVVVLVHVDPGAGADFSDLTRDLTREFVTPPLTHGKEYQYTMTAEFAAPAGTVTHKVSFRAGESVTVDFTASPPAPSAAVEKPADALAVR